MLGWVSRGRLHHLQAIRAPKLILTTQHAVGPFCCCASSRTLVVSIYIIYLANDEYPSSSCQAPRAHISAVFFIFLFFGICSFLHREPSFRRLLSFEGLAFIHTPVPSYTCKAGLLSGLYGRCHFSIHNGRWKERLLTGPTSVTCEGFEV